MNANGFCQRFGDALLFLVARQMRALERSSRSAVTDTSLLGWLKRRDALGPNQSDLFRAYVYTDDPHFSLPSASGASCASCRAGVALR